MSRSFDERCQLYFEEVRQQKSIVVLFGPEMNLKRQKLQNETLSLLSTHQAQHDTQERIVQFFWSKVCHSTISYVRKYRRQLKRGSAQETECRSFMFSMLSFFQHLAFKLSSNLGDVNCILDWSSLMPEHEPVQTQDKGSKAVLERVMIYQGDIARYLLEVEETLLYESFARRCYMQALAINPESIQPMCQLGTLMSSKNFRIDCVYWCFRCLHLKRDSPKACLNLDRILHKNERLFLESSAMNTLESMKPGEFLEFLCKRFCSSLIYVLGKLFFKTSPPKSTSKNMENVEQLITCLDKVLNEFSELCKYFWCAYQHTAFYLNDSIIFNVVVLCIITIDYLQKIDSPKVTLVSGFVLSFFAKILQLSSLRLEFFINAAKRSTKSAETKSCSSSVSKSEDTQMHLSLAPDESASGGKKRTSVKRLRRRRRAPRLSPDIMSEDETTDSHSSSNERRMSIDEYSLSSSNGDEFDSDASISGEEREIEDIENEDKHKKTSAEPQLSGEYVESGNGEQGTMLSLALDEESGEVAHNKLDDSDYSTKVLITLYNFEVAKSLPKLSDVVISVKSNHNLRAMKDQLIMAMEDSGFLAPVKVICDWLKENAKMRNFLHNSSFPYFLAALINRLPVEILYPQFTKSNFETFNLRPIMEDYCLRNVTFLPSKFAQFNWSGRNALKKNEENFTRLMIMREFAVSLVDESSSDSCLKLADDDKTQLESCYHGDFNDFGKFLDQRGFNEITANDSKQRVSVAENAANEKERQKLKLMQNMGQLRLKCEVERLRKEVEQISSNCPFIIPEVYCFTNKLELIKKLTETNKFIVLVCKTVLNSLDSMKKDQPSAREAIKFLESALCMNNSSVRAQKEYEFSPVDLSCVKFNWRRSKKLVSLCDMISCANYFVHPKCDDKSSSNIDVVSQQYKQATLLFEHKPDSTNMTTILNCLGSDSAIGFDVLDSFCEKSFNNNK